MRPDFSARRGPPGRQLAGSALVVLTARFTGNAADAGGLCAGRAVHVGAGIPLATVVSYSSSLPCGDPGAFVTPSASFVAHCHEQEQKGRICIHLA